MEIALFFFTLLALIFSSYFITGLIKDSKASVNLLYLTLIAISQIIISVEALSIFKAIDQTNIQILQFLFLAASCLAWIIFKKPKPKLFDLTTVKNILTTIKQDKFLIVLSLGFVFSSLISLYLAISTSTNIDDDLAYHMPRVFQWIQNHSLAHFQTNEVRQILFPINSEILYLWSAIQLKSDSLTKLVEYASYLISLFVLYNFLELNKTEEKQKIWAVCMLASLPLVIIEASSLQTNLFVASLSFTAVYLFLYSLMKKTKTPLIFSAISIAIAIGTKTTVLFLFPAIAVAFLTISIKELGVKFYKPLFTYTIFLAIFFIALALPNYLMNYLEFNNPLGMPSFLASHKNTGADVFIANIIRYLTALVDFSGIKQADVISPQIIQLKNTLLQLFQIPQLSGVLLDLDIDKVNTLIHEQRSLFGILGFLVVLPYSLRSGWLLMCKKDKEHFYINILGTFFTIFLLTLSATMKYSIDMNRYLLTAAIVSSPMFIFTYFEKARAAKIVLFLIMMFNFLTIPQNIVSRPLLKTLSNQREKGFKETRRISMYTYSDDSNSYRPEKELVEEIKKSIPQNSKIGFITNATDHLYPIYTTYKNYKITIITDLYTNKEELLKNDYLVTVAKMQYSSLYKPFKQTPAQCLDVDIIEVLQLACTIDKDLISRYFKQIKIIREGKKPKYIIYKKNL